MLVDMEDQVYMSYLCVLFITYCLSKPLLGGGDEGEVMQKFSSTLAQPYYACKGAHWKELPLCLWKFHLFHSAVHFHVGLMDNFLVLIDMFETYRISLH